MKSNYMVQLNVAEAAATQMQAGMFLQIRYLGFAWAQPKGQHFTVITCGEQ